MTKNDIIQICFEVSKQDYERTLSKSRHKPHVKVRQLIHFFLRNHTNLTLDEIKDITNHKQHGIVLYSIEDVNRLEFQQWQPYLNWKIEIQKRIDNFKFSGKKLIEISNCGECKFYFSLLCQLISEDVINEKEFLPNCPLKNA